MNSVKRCGIQTVRHARRSRVWACLCLMLGLSGSRLLAADAPPAAPTPGGTSTNAVLSLEALVTEALSRNPELRFYEAEITVAEAGRKAAGRWSNPELGGSVGQKRTVDSLGALRGEGTAWSVSLSQAFEWPGRIGLRKAIANHDVALARIGVERFRAALAARVRTLGFDLFAAGEKASAAREVAERFQALREVFVQRDPAGLTPVLETRVIEATDLTLQHRASEAQLRSRSALLELNQLTGRPLTTRLEVTVPEITFRPAGAAQDLLAAAETNNFDLRLRQVELAQQGFRLELARNQRYPAVTVGPMFSEERSGDRDRIFAVGLSVPLPLWNRGSDNIEAARARQSQAETLLFVAQRDVQRRVLDAAQRYESRLAEMGRWRPDAIVHFRDAAALADRHYRLGAVPVSVYVELQKQYLEAVESLLDARRDALEAAQSLESLTGWPAPLFGPEGRP